MGTYTNNYNLFMPTIGEQGWGELVNNNFSTIDTTMKGFNTRIGTLETETDAMKEKLDAITIDANGTIVGNVQGLLFVPAIINLTSGTVYATCPAISSSTTAASWNMTIPDYTVSSNMPIEHSIGVYTRTEDITNEELAHVNTRTLTFTHQTFGSFTDSTIQYKEASSTEWITLGTLSSNTTATVTLKTDIVYNFKQSRSNTKLNYSVPEKPTVYITYAFI